MIPSLLSILIEILNKENLLSTLDYKNMILPTI